MSLEGVTEKQHECPCGCGNSFPIYSGRLNYGQEQSIRFSVAHMLHCSKGATAWLHLCSGSWFADDDRNCWVTMQLWADKNEVATTIKDPQESPLWLARAASDRYLTREEVLAQQGGKNWAIDRRLEIEEQHAETRQYLQGPAGA